MSDAPSLRQVTYTRLWLFERHYYRAGRKALLVPVPHNLLKWSAVVLVPAFALIWLLGLPTGGPLLALYGFGLGWLIKRTLKYAEDGGDPIAVAWSWWRLSWFTARHARAPIPGTVRVRSTVAQPIVGLRPVTFSSRLLNRPSETQ